MTDRIGSIGGDVTITITTKHVPGQGVFDDLFDVDPTMTFFVSLFKITLIGVESENFSALRCLFAMADLQTYVNGKFRSIVDEFVFQFPFLFT
jgi:hypothetical protein